MPPWLYYRSIGCKHEPDTVQLHTDYTSGCLLLMPIPSSYVNFTILPGRRQQNPVLPFAAFHSSPLDNSSPSFKLNFIINKAIRQEDTLYKAISHNAFLKVWVLCGYYDLATPFYASEWVYRHVFLKDADSDRVQFTYYPSGHMIYLNDEACARFHQEAEDWFRN